MSKSAGEKVLLLGVGNVLMKDDGIGPRLVKYVRRAAEQIGVQCIDAGTPGPNMFAALPAGTIVVVDAVDFGGLAGEAVILDQADLTELVSDSQWSAHWFGLVEALFVARAAGISPDVRIIGVQPSEVEWGLELSEPVREKMPKLARLVMGYLNKCKAKECEEGRH